MIVLPIFLLFHIKIIPAESVTESCSKNNFEECRKFCDRIVPLNDIDDTDWASVENKLFFLETSDKSNLDTRQTCAIESAVQNLESMSAIVVGMTAPELDLSSNKALCELYRLHSEKRLFFRHIDKSKVFENSSLQEVYESDVLNDSPHSVVHYSDAIRLILIYKFGGWYSDLDMIFIRDIGKFRNVISSDDVADVVKGGSNAWKGQQSVSNAIFHFDKGHPMMEKAIQGFSASFKGTVWASGGPRLLTKVLRKLCGLSPNVQSLSPARCSPEKCNGVRLLDPITFYPFNWFDALKLFERDLHPDAYWENFFTESYSVHFYQSSKGKQGKALKRKNYGNNVPGMVYLAERNCPISFASVKVF